MIRLCLSAVVRIGIALLIAPQTRFFNGNLSLGTFRTLGSTFSASFGTLLSTTHAYSIGDVDPRALRGVWRLTSLDEEGLPFERRRRKWMRSSSSSSSSADSDSMTTQGTAAQAPDPRTIWKLRGYLPMKEFTTYPKKKHLDASSTSISSFSSSSFLPEKKKKPTEIFIKLKDDHTFEQCTSLRFSDGIGTDGESDSLEDKLASEVSKRERESFAWKGTWDFLDGKLILAADRPEKKTKRFVYDDYDDDDDDENSEDGGDTILVGKVSVQSEQSLKENPALEKRRKVESERKDDETFSSTEPMTSVDSSSTEVSPAREETDRRNPSSKSHPITPPNKSTHHIVRPNNQPIDIHLSVPRGTIKTGKFMYPKHHPSFFEQPIIHPQPKGSFELRQILGEYNAKMAAEEDEDVELFRKEDLVGKKFYLTTFPLPKRKKKGRMGERWSKSQQKWVTDEYEMTEEEKRREDEKPGKNMQVVAVELFANNTFSTLYGLGSSTILRGKWSIIGQKRDQLWMQIFRFGFGRSVSGSTYSEGMSLTQNDEKAYWGKITEEQEDGGGKEDHIEDDPSQWRGKKIEIKGAVMLGWGLEPCSVGRFKMIEMEDELVEDDINADDSNGDDVHDDEEEDNEINAEYIVEDTSTGHESLLQDIIIESSIEEDLDYSFDKPGAFE